MQKKIGIYDYLSELMLYSGQYALFYIFMNFSEFGLGFFTDFGHNVLLFSLIVQTVVATNLRDKPHLRAISTLIAPLVYTVVEIGGDIEWVLNLAHLFFWIYSLLLASLSYIYEKTSRKNIRVSIEFLITFINVSIFVFIYFYFDLRLSAQEMFAQGLLSSYEKKEYLEIYRIGVGFSEFFRDPAHVFIVYGGFFLALIIALGRVKIFLLNEKINNILAQYMDVRIRDRLLKEESHNDKRELVILFCDIRNFTKISEDNSPSQVVSTLNAYYDEWSSVASLHDGVINKFIGDAVLILYGIDGDINKALKNCVLSSYDMLKRLDGLNKRLANSNLPKIEDIGIGVHRGEVIIGSIGGGSRKDYTVIGDSVNIAQRIEQLTKLYKTPLMLSESAYEILESSMQKEFECAGVETLKGKSQGVKVYALKSKTL
jgi:class 3 adenylate cyclase